MRKILRHMAWIDRKGKVDWFEIGIDILMLTIPTMTIILLWEMSR